MADHEEGAKIGKLLNVPVLKIFLSGRTVVQFDLGNAISAQEMQAPH